MSRKSNVRSNGSSYPVNDSVGVERMPIDDSASNRSFSYKTGIRKYEAGDPSVVNMQKERSKTYRKYGIGIPTAANMPNTVRLIDSKVLVDDFLRGNRSQINTGKINSVEILGKFVNRMCNLKLTDEQRLELTNGKNINIDSIINVNDKYMRLKTYISHDDEAGHSNCYRVSVRNLDYKKRTRAASNETKKVKRPKTLLELIHIRKRQNLRKDRISYKIKKWTSASPKDKIPTNPIRGLDNLKKQDK